MKARLFDQLPLKGEEMFFKVEEDGDNIMVKLVDSAGLHIQYLFTFGAKGIFLSILNRDDKFPFSVSRSGTGSRHITVT